MPARPRFPALLLCALLPAACTYTATGTAPGQLTVNRPMTIPPPPQPPPSPAPAASAAPRTGPYAGTGQLLTNPGARNPCRDTIEISHFVVNGDQVRFGGFRGTIDPGGLLEMQAGHRFVSGQFVGERFVGRFWQPPPACTYSLTLDPVG